MTSVGSNFPYGRPHGADPPFTCIPWTLLPSSWAS